jgi:hypothetical protein
MDGKLVLVARSYSLSEAMVVQSMLAWHGIYAEIFDIYYATTDPSIMVGIGGMRIMVPDQEVESARALIWEGQEGTIPSRPYSEGPVQNGFWTILLALLGVPPPARVPLQKN